MNEVEQIFWVLALGVILEIILIIVSRYYFRYKQKKDDRLFDEMYPKKTSSLNNEFISPVSVAEEVPSGEYPQKSSSLSGRFNSPFSSAVDLPNAESAMVEFSAPEWFPCPVLKVTNMSYDDAFTQAKKKYQKMVPVVIGSGEYVFDDWEQQITERQHEYKTTIELSNIHYLDLKEKYLDSYPKDHDVKYPSIEQTLGPEFTDNVYFIGLVPVEYNWQTLAYLNFGEWNECPSCEYCTALLRVWEERNGMIVWYVKPDTLKVLMPEDATVNNLDQLSIDSINLNPEHYELLSEGVPSEQSLQQMKEEFSTNKNILFWWD